MIHRIWKGLSTLLLTLLVAAAILCAGLRLMGWRAFTVLSGSMEPAYPTGSLICIRPVNPESVEPGQVITFLINENTVATHRVLNIIREPELSFQTKGDSNPTPDGSAVHHRNVLGTPVLTIPRLGYALRGLQTASGRLWTAAAAGLLFLLLLLPELLGR